jgi:predicted membrane-bound mannosyltransferase
VVSPIAIEYGRFAWNPNPIPFFTIVFFYFLFRYLQKKEDMYFYLSVAFANFAFQLHCQGFILVAICFLVLIYRPLRNFRHYLIPITLFVVLLSPFLIYELKTNFENTRINYDDFLQGVAQCRIELC